LKDGLTDTQKFVHDAVQQQLPFIDELPEPDKSRCLMALSYEYFNVEMEEEGFKLLKISDPDYFKEQLEKDMRADEIIKMIAVSIAEKIIDMGLTTVVISDEGEKNDKTTS